MPMDVMPRQQGIPSSALNPNAPMFVPSAYRNVEDFSDQWWSLVRSSPSFRDYWLRECFSESIFDLDNCTDSFFPDDDDDFIDFDDTKINGSKDEEKEVRKDMMLVRLSKWRKARAVDAPRLYQKAPKIVNVKVISPRPIHQPR